MFDTLSKTIMFENLLHNRLNFKAYIGSKITFAAEVRNRLFTGDMVKTMGRSIFGNDRHGSRIRRHVVEPDE